MSPFLVTAIAVLLQQNVALDAAVHASYQCPLLSRHVEVWDQTPYGFHRRHSNPDDRRVYQSLPDGCQPLAERMEQSIRPHSQMSLLQREDRGSAMRVVGKRLSLIPYPALVQVTEDSAPFQMHTNVHLKYDGIDRSADKRSDLALTHLDKLVKNSPSKIDAPADGEVVLSLDPSIENKEGYKLEVTADRVKLSAKDPAGLLYGAQTLRQLTQDSGHVPAALIEDAPRFGWRGLHLDVSRHFFPASDVKKLLDTMVAFKLNSFHWHLTDDQGWRIPIEGYPALVEIGAEVADGTSKSYTMDQIKDVIQYAAARNIQVVPEVDVPGHAAAAISAYPSLGNTDIPDWSPPSRPPTTFGVHPYTISPKPKSFEFIKAVFETIGKTFPSKYIHMGGDEAPKDQWEESRTATSLLQRDGEREVQELFNDHVGRVIKGEGKTVVGWDETQHIGGLPDDAVVMAWRSSDELRRAVSSGRYAVQADQASYYFDHYQAHSGEPKAIGGYLPLQQVYNNDPMPYGLSKEEQSRVLGGQAQLWSEYFPTWHQVEYMAHPRSLALAERLWSPNKEINGFEEFKDRLQVRLKDLDNMGVNYRKLQ
jgi:hexosaminidase